MDHIDRCIVDILQHNARLPVKEIASRVSLSSPAVCARIERLEKSGVLAGYQAMINFYPYIESCTNVVECSCVTGEYSMLIEAYFHTTQELDQFVNYLQKFGRTRTQIVFSTCVEHRGIPLSEDSTLQPPNSLKKSEKNDSDK